MRLLHLDASPRANRSRSREVAQRFLAALPSSTSVTHADLWSMNLPTLEGDMIEGRYDLLHGNPVPEDVSNQWGAISAVAQSFLDHDSFLISTPMWNFGIPYRLKHFVDVVTQPGMTFRNDAAGNVEGLAAGKRALIVAASAMPFGQDAGLDILDFQSKYLEAWLGFIGVTQIDTVNVSPTFGAEDEVAKAMDTASEKAVTLARDW
ncbi:FMN-dependent NADH-azoreductase [Aurantiacibacter marinus]|uniref:FMN dependent NADH:quinone oxidoreductase n=1 Tax=Aurantiacibacter marinus TaxID=874156 RepID=A0A0H0XKM5_9SPHN|nr:NAD(P)H-dependent oxidoreductase [Aurantiacibacter marinus]KLI62879.1 hypothetical protein AAV99_12450 [Aurantiacibacter marinus]